MAKKKRRYRCPGCDNWQDTARTCDQCKAKLKPVRRIRGNASREKLDYPLRAAKMARLIERAARCVNLFDADERERRQVDS